MSGDRYVTVAGYACIAVFLSMYILLKIVKVPALLSVVGGFSTILGRTCIIMSIIGLLLISSGWLSIGRRFGVTEACICGETGLISFSALFLFYVIVKLSHARNALEIMYKRLGKDVLSLIFLFMIVILVMFVITHIVSHFSVSRVAYLPSLRAAGYLHVLLLSCVVADYVCTGLGFLSISTHIREIMNIIVLALLVASCTCSAVAVYKLGGQ
ncbi:MAG: hypothetical protein GXO23_01960 [Crenarchaeota archaeon]|nr:hypothetical protein [Thermoproteota archaeon]